MAVEHLAVTVQLPVVKREEEEGGGITRRGKGRIQLSIL